MCIFLECHGVVIGVTRGEGKIVGAAAAFIERDGDYNYALYCSADSLRGGGPGQGRPAVLPEK